MNQSERDALDRHITGNYGEDQFSDVIATCFSCGADVEIASGDINNCAHCDEPVCLGCRKVHHDECERDCLS